jgi:hypothetical protein
MDGVYHSPRRQVNETAKKLSRPGQEPEFRSQEPEARMKREPARHFQDLACTYFVQGKVEHMQALLSGKVGAGRGKHVKLGLDI